MSQSMLNSVSRLSGPMTPKKSSLENLAIICRLPRYSRQYITFLSPTRHRDRGLFIKLVNNMTFIPIVKTLSTLLTITFSNARTNDFENGK